MNIIIYESNKYRDFHPMTMTRPIFSLKCGITSLADKFANNLKGEKLLFYTRDLLKPITPLPEEARYAEDKDLEGEYIAVNAKVICDEKIKAAIEIAKKSEQPIIMKNEYGEPVVSRLNGKACLEDILDCAVKKNPKIETLKNIKVIDYLWDLVNYNGEMIEKDGVNYIKNIDKIDIYPEGVSVVEKEKVFVDKSAKLCQGVIIDATDGVVIIDKDAKIMHNTVIIGPCYIGKKSTVKIGAKIYENTSIGDVCKVGGEIEGTIIHGYSNKQHDGFLGHAYIGEWCNFGADTNNSDLKNNYSNVLVQINDKLIDSGSMFVGLFMSDHSKTGINTMFNTGTVVGIGCNVFGEGFPPRFIPSFEWGGKEKLVKYPYNRILETARIVMNRRGVKLTKEMETVLKTIYDNREVN